MKLVEKIIKIMNDLKYNKLVTRIFWFALPLVITLLTYLVVSSYARKEVDSIVSTKVENISNIQEKIWELVQENNKVLMSKADQETNEREHRAILTKVEQIDLRVNSIWKNEKYYSQTLDTIDTLPNQFPLKEYNEYVEYVEYKK